MLQQVPVWNQSIADTAFSNSRYALTKLNAKSHYPLEEILKIHTACSSGC